MKRIVLYLVIILLGITAIRSQEVLTDFGTNPKIQNQYQQQLLAPFEKSVDIESEPLMLPFFDDFNQEGIFPDQQKWFDNEAYVNANFPFSPPNYGAATLDVVDSTGNVYSNASTFPFVADRLTSRPIRLDSIYDPDTGITSALSPSDSLYLSFFYQPQGYGNPPEPEDSLIVEFGVADSVFSTMDSVSVFGNELLNNDTAYLLPGDTIISPCDSSIILVLGDTLYYEDEVAVPCDSIFVESIDWSPMWNAEGDTLEQFLDTYGTYFRQVMLPIKDSAFFIENFRFRFLNYGSVSTLPSWKSNVDQWNIDYVYLNANRSQADTFYHDIGIANHPSSLLKNYTAMPSHQFVDDPTNAMADSIEMKIANLDSVEIETTYRYVINEEQGDSVFGYNAGSHNLVPFLESGYTDYGPFAKPPVNYYYHLNPLEPFDSSLYRVSHIISAESGNLGDTVDYLQEFYNYYAYDDGTPEKGYGLTPAGAKLAYRFTLNKPDTLRGIKMFFNKTFLGANQEYPNEQFFHLTVWDDNNGTPGDVIYSKENTLPKFDSTIYTYHTYFLDEEPVPITGTFYVGWIQTTSHSLNLGFDSNTNSQNNILYNSEGSWINSSFEGSLMIRPIVGREITDYIPTIKNYPEKLVIYPNPAGLNTAISFLLPKGLSAGQQENLNVDIYDLSGRIIHSSEFTDEINSSFIGTGLYLVIITDQSDGQQYKGKFMIQ